MTQSPTLIYPDLSKLFIIDVDASNVSVAAVLSQVVDGVEHPVANFNPKSSLYNGFRISKIWKVKKMGTKARTISI